MAHNKREINKREREIQEVCKETIDALGVMSSANQFTGFIIAHVGGYKQHPATQRGLHSREEKEEKAKSMLQVGI